MRHRGLTSLVVFVSVTVLALLGVLIAEWRPLLGLDLQGGVAVVLRPTVEADDGQLDEAIGIIRNRVDAIGVAEPDISRQGGNIVVQLPGVSDRERALELVGSTAELRFRPVLNVFPPPGLVPLDTSTPPPSGENETDIEETDGQLPIDVTGGRVPGGSLLPGPTGDVEETDGSLPLPDRTTAPTATPVPTTTPAGSGTSEQGSAGTGAGPGELALAATTTTTAPAPTAMTVPTDTPASTDPVATTAVTALPVPQPAGSGIPELTPREGDLRDATVVLAQNDPSTGDETARYQLGPTLVTGDALVAGETQANLVQSQWIVQLSFRDGDANVGAWRAAAQACFQASNPAICPTGRLAAVLDGEVISAPQVNDTFSTGNEAIISGSFNEGDARDLAQKLRYGALPVTFERQQSQDVSATVGRDALRAGIAAGIIGLVIVALYILAFYRLLGLVAIASLALSFGLLWSIISWLGETQGLALSLSGVVGIVVAIGISIDSNIVYFEQIKDDAVSGRTLRSAAQRAFSSAMSTIVKADAVSLIGAALLYWLTVGPVKGFALFLGLSALLDLLASYFFMRPAVGWLFRSERAAQHPSRYGMPASIGPASVVPASATGASPAPATTVPRARVSR